MDGPSTPVLDQPDAGRRGRPGMPLPRAHLRLEPLEDPLWEIRRTHRRRRLLTLGIVIVGIGDVLSALLPPSRPQLTALLHVLPLEVAQGAAVLLALCGLVLVSLAWGLRRGQRQAWTLSCAALAVAGVMHLVHSIDALPSLLNLALLAAALGLRGSFRAPIDRRATAWTLLAAAGALVGTIVIATASLEGALAVDHDRGGPLPLHLALAGVTERLAGVRSIALPERIDRFLSPTLLGVGLALAVVAVLVISRPLVDRTLRPGKHSHEVARRLVNDHGGGTLDYFALRYDKWHHITGQTLITYAVHGGVCLVSPDPIGPLDERESAWAAFCRFADTKGWLVAVLGASAPWLTTYQRGGMHSVYVGDEAVVSVDDFHLAGGHKKGLRQAVQRVRRHGYRVSFHDPLHLDLNLAASLRELMAESRRGHGERGFSMTLGRLFDSDDDGLLLAVAHASDGQPVAFCQFVPAPSIGGYSLDVMRRDQGAHPNGLIDFLLVSTIEHLREQGFRSLSLNFAAMRAYIAGERDANWADRVLGRVLRRLSRSMQVESLWRFNAKYDPSWAARYVVFGSVMHLPAIGLAIARAESLWELPLLGRYLASGTPQAVSRLPQRVVDVA